MFTWNCFNTNVPGAENVATISCIADLLKNLIGAVLALAGIALFVMLLYGGFLYLFSGGDQKKLQMAGGTITSAVLGLVVIVSSYLILLTIQAITGVDLTTFKLNF